LLGRKPGEALWRFPGGFVDPQHDLSLEMAAKREAREECGDIELGPAKYLGSIRINDWRYRSSCDKITTALFELPYLWGGPRAGDDLKDVAWFALNADLKQHVNPIHHPLLEMLITHGV
jgi:bifunctional NMN adenylyltransferase/nudix hydrolase